MKFLRIGGLLLGMVTSVFGNQFETNSTQGLDWKDNFNRGEREVTLGTVAYFSPWISLSGRPVINYAGGFVQLGYMLSDLDEQGWSGNFEGLAEGYYASIFKGQGNYMAGTTIWLRYNIVPPRWKLVPYLQAGAGMTLTDADRTILGQDFNFNLNLAAGTRYFVQPNCSINAEYRYQHISNAGMADRNVGIDAQGAVLSVSWFF